MAITQFCARVRIPGAILRRRDLTVTAKRLYAQLDYSQNGGESIQLTTAWLASCMCVSRQKITRAINCLVKAKLLRVKRRFKQASIYSIRAVSSIKFFLFLPNGLNSGHTESMTMIMAYLEYREGDNDCSWPHLSTIAEDLGISRSKVCRLLSQARQGGLLQVKNAHGGLKQGNKYSLTNGGINVLFWSARTESGASKRVTKDNTTSEVKDSSQVFSQKTLLSPDQRTKKQLLLRYGVKSSVAVPISQDETVSLHSVQTAIKNGLAREDRQRLWRMQPGYIVAAVNRAKHEGHQVTASKACRRAQDDIEAVRTTRLDGDELAARKAKIAQQAKQLLAEAAA